jgi:protein gp37
MSDLFHVDVPFEFIAQVWFIMTTNPRHTFIVLTKRPERMYEFCSEFLPKHWGEPVLHPALPAANVWLGVSAENQSAADERIPYLLQTPAAVRFVSVEPMLESIAIDHLKYCAGNSFRSLIDWVICGAESGPRARPFDIDWARSLRDQCTEAGVAYFLKQMPVDGKLTKMPFLDGRQWEEYPTCARG